MMKLNSFPTDLPTLTACLLPPWPCLQRPNTGACGALTLSELKDKGYRKVSDAVAEPIWTFW